VLEERDTIDPNLMLEHDVPVGKRARGRLEEGYRAIEEAR